MVLFIGAAIGLSSFGAHAQMPPSSDGSFMYSPGSNDAPAANMPAGMGMGMTPEEAAAMEAQMELEAAKSNKKRRDETVERSLRQVLPMAPEEIVKTLKAFEESRRAAEEPISVPTPQIHVETVSLDPGVAPSVIQTSVGHVTTLSFLDVTGQPWPIQDASFAGQFEMTAPEEGGHVIRIVPLSAHGVGNISIRLVDLITPVIFTLKQGLETSHYRFDARIPKMGPLAQAPLIDHGGLSAVAGDETLVSFLMGVPPSEAEKMRVDGVDGMTTAWSLAGNIYLRTPLTLLSPGWSSSLSSADGMKVYRVGDAPVMILSDRGRMVQARIASWENEDE